MKVKSEMTNIYPRAERVELEPIIGSSRSVARAPVRVAHESTSPPSETGDAIFIGAVPEWFKRDSLSEHERGVDITVRNRIVDFYQNKRRNIGVGEVYGLFAVEYEIGLFDSILGVFNVCEELRLINTTYSGITEQLFTIETNGSSNNSSNGNSSNNNNNYSNNHNNNSNIINTTEYTYLTEKYTDPTSFIGAKCGECNKQAEYFTSGFEFSCEECRGEDARHHRITGELAAALWDKKEEYWLLRGIEEHRDSWESVAEMVNERSGSGRRKSKEMCIFHFINQGILERIEEYETLPFSKFENQTTALVAFFSMLDGAISAAVAGEFLRVMQKKEREAECAEHLIAVAVEEAKRRVELKRRKIGRLQEVKLDAWIKKIELKMDAIEEMYGEVEAVRGELVEKRSNLMDEIARLN
ncbi:hypothetical protein ECANGB1_474 [Enterospora canceri]|uniref:Myb-like domain-containing protein n=1 Tax=Enterospora canceri TaxID=1081671 RepID=A0A1Y1S7Z0_9MICR|nr:hypothetical protein ECANGB1_474 [Enterospora canceri]